MNCMPEWWNKRTRELEAARRDNEEAREGVAKTMKQAQERGAAVYLSQEALKRIASIDPTR